MAKHYYISESGGSGTVTDQPLKDKRYVEVTKEGYKAWRQHAEADVELYAQRAAERKKGERKEYTAAERMRATEAARAAKKAGASGSVSEIRRQKLAEARQPQSKKKTQEVRNEEGKVIATLSQPAKTYEQRVAEARAQRGARQTGIGINQSLAPREVRERIYGSDAADIQEGGSGRLLMLQGQRAQQFVSEQAARKKQKEERGIGRTTGETRYLQAEKKLSEQVKAGKITENRKQTELRQIMGENIQTWKRDRDIARFESRVAQIQEKETKIAEQAAKSQKVASYATLGFGKPMEERTLPGKVAETYAGFYTHLPAFGATVALGVDKTLAGFQYRKVRDKEGAAAARREAADIAAEEIKKPEVLIASGIAVATGALWGKPRAPPRGAEMKVTGRTPRGRSFEYRIWEDPVPKPKPEPSGIKTRGRVVPDEPGQGIWSRVRRAKDSTKDFFKREKDRAKDSTKDFFKREKTKDPGKDVVVKDRTTRRGGSGVELWRPKTSHIVPRTDPIRPPARQSTDLWQKPKPSDPGKDITKPSDPGKDITKPSDPGKDIIIRDRIKAPDKPPPPKPPPPKPPPPIGPGVLWPFGGLDLSFPGGGGLLGRFGVPGRAQRDKRKRDYYPSLAALAFNIRGKAPGNLTGLEFRPIKLKK